MNKILLINRISPQDNSEEKKKIFFALGGMDMASVENNIIDLLKNSAFIDINDMVLKYNGIELNIRVQQIPQVIKLFCREDILVYSIYQLYNPDL